MELKLRSPVGAKPISYIWPLTTIQEKDMEDGALDIVQTMKWVCVDMPELSSALKTNILCHYDMNNLTSMKNMVKRFNLMIDTLVQLEKGTSLPYNRINKYPSRGLLRHILQQTYNRAVEDPEKLNQYEPFSPEVYGETSYDFVCAMIDRINVTSEDVFIDLGSGVGQVVLQMAAGTQCKICIGIERAQYPNKYADNMNKYFRAWMQWYGKKFGEYTFIKDDFLLDKYRETISQASIVFVNNYAFGPTVDHQLKELFGVLKDGTRIISSRSFCSPNSRITPRNITDICSIMHVYQIPSIPGSVSWTGKPVPYYLHIIDRSKLHNYFLQLRIGDMDSNGNASTSTSACSSCEETKPNSSNYSSNSDSDYTDYSDSEQKKLIKDIFGRNIKATYNKQKNDCPYEFIKKTKAKKTIKSEKKVPYISEYKDQQLLTTNTETVHTELTQIPPETYEALQNLLDVYRAQFMQMIQTMGSTQYKNQIESLIIQEKEKNPCLQHRALQLEEEIKILTKNNIALLKTRMSELDIKITSSRDLVDEVNEMMYNQSELKVEAYKLKKEVDILEKEQISLVAQRQEEIIEKYREIDPKMEINKEIIQELVLREISSALEHRNKLQNQVSTLQNEIIDLKKTNKEKIQTLPTPKFVPKPGQQRGCFKKKKPDDLLRNLFEKNIKMKDRKLFARKHKKKEDSNKIVQKYQQQYGDTSRKKEDSNKNVQKDQRQYANTGSNVSAKQSSNKLPINYETREERTSKVINIFKLRTTYNEDIKQKKKEAPKYKESANISEVKEEHHVAHQIPIDMKLVRKLQKREKILKKLSVQQQHLKAKLMNTKPSNELKSRKIKTILVTSEQTKGNETTRPDDSAKSSSTQLAKKKIKKLETKGEQIEIKLHQDRSVHEERRNRTSSGSKYVTVVKSSGLNSRTNH